MLKGVHPLLFGTQLAGHWVLNAGARSMQVALYRTYWALIWELDCGRSGEVAAGLQWSLAVLSLANCLPDKSGLMSLIILTKLITIGRTTCVGQINMTL